MTHNRRTKYLWLLMAANNQSSEWLRNNLRDYRANHDVSRLSMLACVTTIASREFRHLTHRKARKAVLESI